MSKKTKVIESNVQPNPKEAEIWAKVNEDGSREIKQYNSSTGKFECCGGSGNGSESGEASGGEYIYLDLRSIDLGSNDSFQYLTIIALSQLTYYNGVIYGENIKGVVPYGFIAFMEGDIVNIKGLAVDKTCKVTNVQDGSLIGIEEYIIMNVGELYNSIPRITKEEFYNLEA